MLARIENWLMALLAVMGLTLVTVEVVLRYFFPRYLTDWGMEFTSSANRGMSERISCCICCRLVLSGFSRSSRFWSASPSL
jgi:hypothetical protein